jgi:hypothetical protein
MSLELQRQHENIIIMHLKEVFDVISRIERYKTFKELFHYKIIEGLSVNTHMLKMIDYFKKLSQLGFLWIMS